MSKLKKGMLTLSLHADRSDILAKTADKALFLNKYR